MPETMTKITPITTWWMCRPPPAEMLRGCHHLRRFVAVGVAADVSDDRAGDEEGEDERDEAEHQRHPPVRYVQAPIQAHVHAENLRCPGGDVPGIWSGAPRSADSLGCDMSRLGRYARSGAARPGGAGWWPTVAWRLFQLLTLAAVVWAGWRLLGHVTYRIDIDVYRMGGRAWLDGQPLYADGAMFETQVGLELPFTYPPLAAIAFAPFALLSLSVAGAAITVTTFVLLDRVDGDRADPPRRLADVVDHHRTRVAAAVLAGRRYRRPRGGLPGADPGELRFRPDQRRADDARHRRLRAAARRRGRAESCSASRSR